MFATENAYDPSAADTAYPAVTSSVVVDVLKSVLATNSATTPATGAAPT